MYTACCWFNGKCDVTKQDMQHVTVHYNCHLYGFELIVLLDFIHRLVSQKIEE